MAGLNHLKDIYNKQGEKFIESLFNEYVIVSEKLNASRFAFQKVKDGCEYFKKGNYAINRIDRTVMIFYESAISYIDSIDESIMSEIPENYVFGFEYFVNKKPINIAYDKLPKNNLVLTDIHVKDNAGQTKKIIKDSKVLNEWADKLGVDRPPIIFKGFLTDTQKQKLLEFLQTPLDSLMDEYKTKSFVRYIIGTLNPKLKSSALMEDLEKPIEGVIFEFFLKNYESYSAKIVDPVFAHILREKNIQPRQSSDIYNLVLLDIIEFIRFNGSFNTYNLKEIEEDARYLELMSLTFNDYIKKNGSKYIGMDLNSVEFSKSPEFNLNYAFVTNEKTLANLKQSQPNRELFKIFLNSFRKKRKNSKNNIIDESLLNEINLLVDKVNKIISDKPKQNSKNEFEFLTFKEFYDKKHQIKDVFESDEEEEFCTPLETEKVTIVSVLKVPQVIEDQPLRSNESTNISVGSTGATGEITDGDSLIIDVKK